MNLTVDSTGNTAGTVAALSGSGAVWTVSGSTGKSGQANLTLTPKTGAAVTWSGQLSSPSSGTIGGTLTSSAESSAIPIRLGSGSPAVFASSLAGSYVTSSGGTGTETLVVSPGGAITGNATPSTGTATSFTGSVSPLGVVSLSASPGFGSSTSFTGGAAYDVSGRLIFVLYDPSTGLTLSLNTYAQS